MAGKEAATRFDDEQIIEIEIERLRSFKDHPFKVEDDKDMHLLKDSIKKYGVLNPLIVRPVPDGVYEIISGHRRRYAAQQLGYRKVPVIIRVMNDEEAIIKMVDSNLQRERISYSEKAFAYKMKNDAMKRTAAALIRYCWAEVFTAAGKPADLFFRIFATEITFGGSDFSVLHQVFFRRKLF